jgi:lipopolysaccharide/colanic/teichoic acid biosynthesis glycosyltransferase
MQGSHLSVYNTYHKNLQRSKAYTLKWMLFKRLFDILLSIVLLILMLPLIMLMAIIIRIETPGNPIFIQKRVGINGKLFTIFKIRTLYKHHFGIFLNKDEPEAYRITPVGKYLRRSKLDELPQLLNILLGSMSFVGPRPYIPEQFNFNPSAAIKRVTVKPGLTCIAQISGNIKLGKPNIAWMDIYYIENYSFLLDLKIILLTFKAILLGDNALPDPFKLQSQLPVKVR